jgi:hypothetical protein
VGRVAELGSLGRAATPLMKRRPILSGVCVVVMFLAIVLPFALGTGRGGWLDVQLRNWLPFVGAALAVAAFIRRERVLWPILGLLLTSILCGTTSRRNGLTMRCSEPSHRTTVAIVASRAPGR